MFRKRRRRRFEDVSFKATVDIKGYYFDPHLKSYFKIPRSGDVGYERYIKIRKEKERMELEELNDTNPLNNLFIGLLKRETLLNSRDICSQRHSLASMSYLNLQPIFEESLHSHIHTFSYNHHLKVLLTGLNYLNIHRFNTNRHPSIHLPHQLASLIPHSHASNHHVDTDHDHRHSHNDRNPSYNDISHSTFEDTEQAILHGHAHRSNNNLDIYDSNRMQHWNIDSYASAIDVGTGIHQILWKDNTSFSTLFMGDERCPGHVSLYKLTEHGCRKIYNKALHRGSLWCHCWSPNNQLALGGDRGASIGKTKFIFNSTVSALCFPDKNRLYTGRRDGKIHVIDPRVKFTKGQVSFEQNHPISHIKELTNEMDVLSSSNDGTILLWDRRTLKVKDTFKFENNFYPTKFETNDTETFMYCGGSDKCIYIWCLNTGKLITKMGPFENTVHQIQHIKTYNTFSKGYNEGILFSCDKDIKYYQLHV